MSRDALLKAMDPPLNIQVQLKHSETIEFEKWRAVPGPDYV